MRNGGWEICGNKDALLVREVAAKDGEPDKGTLRQVWVHEGILEQILWDIHVRRLAHAGMDRTWQTVQECTYGVTQSLCRRFVVLCGCVKQKKQSRSEPQCAEPTRPCQPIQLGPLRQPSAQSDATAQPTFLFHRHHSSITSHPSDPNLHELSSDFELAGVSPPSPVHHDHWPLAESDERLPPPAPKRINMSAEERAAVVAQKQAYAHITQPQLMKWCTEVLGKTPSQPMISKILRQARDAGQLPPNPYD